MNFAGIQPQILVSAIVILGAAAVALLVDYLRGKNAQLREAMVELRLRREKDQRQAAAAPRPLSVTVSNRQAAAPPAPTPEPPKTSDDQKNFIAAAAQAAAARISAENGASHHAPRIETSTAPSEFPASLSEPNVDQRHVEARDRNLAARQAQDRAIEYASTHGRRRHSTPPPENLPRLEDMNPREALSQWLTKRAAARPTSKPASVELPATLAPAEPLANEPVTIESTPVALVASVAPEPVAVPEPPVVEIKALETLEALPTPVAKQRPQASVVVDAFLWESILENSRVRAEATKETAPARTEPRFEVIQGSNRIPAGMQELSTYRRLLDANRLFTGLVVSISANRTDARPVDSEVMLEVRQFVRGLLYESDFACQCAENEFVMLCSDVLGADARARLSEISERLWDFQLRGLGNFSILFSWGDAEIDGEPLTEAVASAAERMHQTRRARKSASIESVVSRKQAVAGR